MSDPTSARYSSDCQLCCSPYVLYVEMTKVPPIPVQKNPSSSAHPNHERATTEVGTSDAAAAATAVPVVAVVACVVAAGVVAVGGCQ